MQLWPEMKTLLLQPSYVNRNCIFAKRLHAITLFEPAKLVQRKCTSTCKPNSTQNVNIRAPSVSALLEILSSELSSSPNENHVAKNLRQIPAVAFPQSQHATMLAYVYELRNSAVKPDEKKRTSTTSRRQRNGVTNISRSQCRDELTYNSESTWIIRLIWRTEWDSLPRLNLKLLYRIERVDHGNGNRTRKHFCR